MSKSEKKILHKEKDWVIVEVDGREVAQRSTDYLKEAESRLIGNAAIPDRYLDKELDSFETKHTVLKAARSFVQQFIREFPAVEKGLLLVGPPGTGKTHLATCALKDVIRKCSLSGLFVDYRELIRSIQDSFNRSTETTSRALIEPVLRAELLVMDELGALKPTEWVLDTITYIINNRYTNNRITIFTTNFSVENVDQDGARLQQDDKFHQELDQLNRKSPSMEHDEYKIRRKRLMEKHNKQDLLDFSLEEKIGSRLMSRLYEMCHFIPFNGVPDYRKSK